LVYKAACNKKRATHFRPSRLWQTAKRLSNPVALGQRYMVKVQSACTGHAVIRRQDTSVVIARIVRVTGTTMISFK